MPNLTKAILVEIAKAINSSERIERRKLYGDMFTMFEGGGRKLICKAIRQEFQNPDTIKNLESRVIPINIMKKVVNKLAGVYKETPSRQVVDQSEADKVLLELHEDSSSFNLVQKECNRNLVMYRKNLKQSYVDNDGIPKWKNLPAHTYEVFNFENKDPTVPDVICVIDVWDVDNTKQEIQVWTKDDFKIINGDGDVLINKMADLENPTGVNPIGALPFVYTTLSTTTIDPIVEEDLLSISIAIPIILSDLFFACKYQSWSILWAVGVIGKIVPNPNQVIQLQYDKDGKEPKLGQIQPNVDADKVMKMVEGVIGLFLSTKGLSAGTISLGKTADAAVSGVSKAFDSAEVVEDKQDQQDYLRKDENQSWKLVSKNMVPYWQRNQLLDPEINKSFSSAFRISIIFKDPKPLLSDKDKDTNAVYRINNKLNSYKRELQARYPDYTEEQIDELIAEIAEERKTMPEIFPQAVDPNAKQPGMNEVP